MNIIEDIENRFLEVTELKMDLSKFPIKKSDYTNQQQKTTNESSKKFGFVTTPIFIVDAMIKMKKQFNPEMTTLDVCSGCGQFSIRMLRYLYNEFNIDVRHWLKYKHSFNEFQILNCAKLVYIFGNEINLYCGDAKKLPLSNEDDSGLLFFNDDKNKWEHNILLDELLKNNKITNNLKNIIIVFNLKDSQDKLKFILDKLN